MKKFLALLLAFAMTLALVACGEKKDDKRPTVTALLMVRRPIRSP